MEEQRDLALARKGVLGYLNKRQIMGALPPIPRGFSGIGGSSGYSNKYEVGKHLDFCEENIPCSLIRLSLSTSVRNVARLCLTGQLRV
jgi:hypothetical protein